MEQLMKLAAPRLYEALEKELEQQHIHPHDIYATVTEAEQGLEIGLRFAQQQGYSTSLVIKWDQIDEPDEATTRFFRQSAQQCKKHLIADYFKMIKP